MELNVIITGVTGMVGEGVLHECLMDTNIKTILVIGRKTCGYSHPKIKEIIHSNFFDITPIKNELKNYNTCFFCLGVSSVGMKEEEYFKFSHTLTLHFATVLSEMNPNMTFSYISGSGTDSTEKGKVMWARVKGKTENDLKKLPFKQVFLFRPGYMHPTKGLKNTLTFYKYIGWLYPILRTLTTKYVSTLAELGRAMINTAKYGNEKQILEVEDIIKAAK